MTAEASATPLARKLGIRPGATVALVDAPDGFEATLALPPGVRVRRRARGPVDVLVIFATERARLAARFAALVHALDAAGGLWVAYPKKAARMASDLDFGAVQRIGLAAGLVDNKSCAVDEVWTAVRFVVRLADRPGGAKSSQSTG